MSRAKFKIGDNVCINYGVDGYRGIVIGINRYFFWWRYAVEVEKRTSSNGIDHTTYKEIYIVYEHEVFLTQ